MMRTKLAVNSNKNIFQMELNIGIAGVGNFARFAVKVFLKVPGIKLVAITDRDEVLVSQTAAAWNVTGYTQYEAFLEDSRIDLVYIATPPFLHYKQSKMALLKGKHVICEKPAALKTSEAEELATLAGSLQLLWVVNLMQRYNPLYTVVKRIVEEKIFGHFLHGFFENYASDEDLGPDHWFWDEGKSGGIFIEHGVHFFDMFSGWLGKGKVSSAFQLERPGLEKQVIDRVQATVLYDEGAVNFYHGFDQPKILDRQEMRLQFEQGDITLYGWIPVKMRLHGLMKKETLERIHEWLGVFSVVHQNAGTGEKKVRGRFRDIVFDTHTTLEFGNASSKQDRYEELLMAMIKDQWDWIRDRKHIRVIDERNAVQSLKMAEAAKRIAQKL
jgi:predicted dehydrogenase